jgi:hypothetical protein
MEKDVTRQRPWPIPGQRGRGRAGRRWESLRLRKARKRQGHTAAGRGVWGAVLAGSEVTASVGDLETSWKSFSFLPLPLTYSHEDLRIKAEDQVVFTDFSLKREIISHSKKRSQNSTKDSSVASRFSFPAHIGVYKRGLLSPNPSSAVKSGINTGTPPRFNQKILPMFCQLS